MNLFPLALRYLTRSKRRSILTILSIGVSVFIFAALISLPALVDEILRDPAGALRLIAQSKAGGLYQMPESYRRRILSVPHVEAVTGYNIFLGTYRDPNLLMASVGVDSDSLREIWSDWGISAGEERAFQSERTGCLVGPTLLRRFRWKIGDNFILHGSNYPADLELKIVGTIGDRAPDGVIIFRRDYLEEILGRPGKVNAFFIKLDKSESAPAAIADIDRMFANSSSESSTGTETDAIKERVGSLALLMNGAKFFAAIVILTIGLVAANTSAMAVRERRHEIGVMRAIGFTRGNVVTGILIEGLVIGVTGGILGCALARLGFLVLPHAGGSLGPLAMRLKLSPRVIANSFAVATVIGAMSALIPAMFATRGDISAKLRAI